MEKLYKLDYLEEISGGDEDFIKDMIVTFVDNALNDINQIKEFAKQENWQKAGEEAHRFASSLVFLQLDSLKRIAIEIEESGIERKNVTEIPDLIKNLEEGCKQVIYELKTDFKL
jgi:HPt (histidine-containing phosphotransfer) domain-containing protein